MQLYPAIDIKGGQCVRLTQGLFDQAIPQCRQGDQRFLPAKRKNHAAALLLPVLPRAGHLSMGRIGFFYH